jgi:hypothetical protein
MKEAMLYEAGSARESEPFAGSGSIGKRIPQRPGLWENSLTA